jgi:hypothetical protein
MFGGVSAGWCIRRFAAGIRDLMVIKMIHNAIEQHFVN